MILICSKCGYQYESLIIGNAEALRDINNKAQRHIHSKHSEIVPLMQQAIAAAMGALPMVMHMKEMMFIPDSETFVKELVEQQTAVVMAAIGYDTDDTDDSEEEDDEEGDEESISELNEGKDTVGGLQLVPEDTPEPPIS